MNRRPPAAAFLGMLMLGAGPVAVDDARSAAADQKRLDPEIIELETPGGLTILDVSYSLMLDLCADGDGCSLRMVLLEGGSAVDDRWFLLNSGTGGWSANISGGALATSGSASNTTDEIVFSVGGDAMCTFRDATEFDFILLRKFQLWADGSSLFPGPSTCVLRIED